MAEDQPDLLALTDLITPWAIRVAATLRLADLIGQGVSRLDELAAAAGADADALGRLLRYLTCRGLFSEPELGTFALTETARELQDGRGMRAWLDLDGMGGRMDQAFSGLLSAVRTAKPAYARLYGRSLWDDLAVHPDLRASFDKLMAVKSSWFAADVVAGYDWATVGHVVDVGGGNGVLLTEILRAHDKVQGTIVDLPDTAAAAREAIAAAGLADRCDVVAGSFFEPLPAGGDVYVLWNVLHDWDDGQAVEILRRCAEAARPSGRVLVIEFTEHEQQTFTAIDLRMLVLLGSRERTVEQFRVLASAAGLTLRSTQRTPAGLWLLEWG